ncbi:hypothetical protein L195_g008164 [Trifolium pratense]|uniref:Uncharacterized protein n=1 Tax=Trifolium pratense TaxID=57577 RepID=A0A2K3P8D7_TRIPR|nr:hypothetical protein L195_g008164 [Trifolium pratense]
MRRSAGEEGFRRPRVCSDGGFADPATPVTARWLLRWCAVVRRFGGDYGESFSFFFVLLVMENAQVAAGLFKMIETVVTVVGTVMKVMREDGDGGCLVSCFFVSWFCLCDCLCLGVNWRFLNGEV